MISIIVGFVLLACTLPIPVFAIPPGDILGPILSWFAVMLGFVSASFVMIGSWINRRFGAISKRDVRIILFSIAGLCALFIGIQGFISWMHYRDLQREIAEAFEKDAKEAQAIFEHVTSSGVVPPPSPSSTIFAFGTRDLISSRVASSTKLVPTAVLLQVVAEPHWSDRILVLDIREPEEHEIGFVDATTTDIRYGDLIHDGLASLPHDRDILVICWTSKRGEEITTLLRAQGFSRVFAIKGGLQGEPILGIKDGDPGWIDAGLPWHGDDRWSDRFTNFTYVTLSEAKKRFDAGATLIDARDAESFDAGHLPGAINIAIKYLPSSEINRLIASLDPNKKTLLITCADYVDCFYARVLGVRLSRLGWEFDEPFRDLAAWKKSGYPIEKTSQ